LWPGAFTDVALTVRTIKDAVVVPQAAIIQGARGSIVYVAQDGKALLRPVQVLQTEGADAVVSGVKAGEAIVLDGKQNLRPDAKLVERAANPAVAKPAAANPPEGKAP
jgi:copper homeostasis protein CutC